MNKDISPELIKAERKLEWIASILGLIAILTVLVSALYVQFFLNEAPCPLCLLQRAGFVSIGIALLMNIFHEVKASHWALALFSAIAGIAVSMRQILLHITDPVGKFAVIFGLHMYTWSAIAFAIAIVGCTLMLLLHIEKK